MYKTIEELREMSVRQVVEYVNSLEQEDEGAKNNSFEYQNWCMNELDEVLEETNISLDEFSNMLKIEKAINILVENGTKREYAEDEFECLSDPLENAEKVINNKDFAMAYARDLNFINDDIETRKDKLKAQYKELENKWYDELERIENKTKEKIKELNNGKLSYKELSQEDADEVIRYRKQLFANSNLGKIKNKMNEIDKEIKSIKEV